MQQPFTDRELFRAMDEHQLSQAVTVEEERLRRIRRQMREQDERRFMDPTKAAHTPDTYVMFAWQRRKWNFITVLRGKVTPKRIARLRHKYRKRIAAEEVVRVVELRVARMLGGAGAAPLPPPRSVRPSRLAKHNARIAAKEAPVRVKARRTVSDKKLSKCEMKTHKKRCSFRAPWFVAYTDIRTHRRIVRKRCGRHAWDDRFLPPHVKQVVRVARQLA